MVSNSRDEIVMPLANGGTLRCGPGEDCAHGGYLRICDNIGYEILYWDCSEWEEDGEHVIGAVFAASLKSIKELTKDRKLVNGVWVFDRSTVERDDELFDDDDELDADDQAFVDEINLGVDDDLSELDPAEFKIRVEVTMLMEVPHPGCDEESVGMVISEVFDPLITRAIDQAKARANVIPPEQLPKVDLFLSRCELEFLQTSQDTSRMDAVVQEVEEAIEKEMGSMASERGIYMTPGDTLLDATREHFIGEKVTNDGMTYEQAEEAWEQWLEDHDPTGEE